MEWQRRLLLMFALVPLLGSSSSARIIEDLPSNCYNTVQGPHLLADSQGYVCSARDIDFERGCCPQEGQQYPCLSCNLTSQCCNTFEYCVSCCLDPIHTSKKFALSSKSSRQLTAVNYGSVFEYCAGRCRHNSASVVHENAYTSEDHHCFFTQTNLSSSVDHGAEAEEHIDYTLISGRRGQSCDEVCHQRGKNCRASALASINKCSVLQKFMSCKGACFARSGSDLPSEVATSAPRHLHPGACLYNSKPSQLSCQGSHRYTKRLCPCG